MRLLKMTPIMAIVGIGGMPSVASADCPDVDFICEQNTTIVTEGHPESPIQQVKSLGIVSVGSCFELGFFSYRCGPCGKQSFEASASEKCRSRSGCEGSQTRKIECLKESGGRCVEHAITQCVVRKQ